MSKAQEKQGGLHHSVPSSSSKLSVRKVDTPEPPSIIYIMPWNDIAVPVIRTAPKRNRKKLKGKGRPREPKTSPLAHGRNKLKKTWEGKKSTSIRASSWVPAPDVRAAKAANAVLAPCRLQVGAEALTHLRRVSGRCRPAASLHSSPAFRGSHTTGKTPGPANVPVLGTRRPGSRVGNFPGPNRKQAKFPPRRAPPPTPPSREVYIETSRTVRDLARACRSGQIVAQTFFFVLFTFMISRGAISVPKGSSRFRPKWDRCENSWNQLPARAALLPGGSHLSPLVHPLSVMEDAFCSQVVREENPVFWDTE